jgi:hypothetical protein
VWTTSCGSDTLFRIDLQGVAPEPEPVAITPNFTR